MKVTELLRAHHQKTKQDFERARDGNADTRDILLEIADELAAHMRLEEEIFYPIVQEALRDHEMIPEAREEHIMAAVGLARVLDDIDEETLEARVSVLAEIVRHHIQEEEKDVFPEIEKALGRERSEELATEMESRFEELLAAGHEALLENYPRLTEDARRTTTRGTARRGASNGRGGRSGTAARSRRTSAGARATGTKRSASASRNSKAAQQKKATKKKTAARSRRR
jgi:hemerythrin-like domain-containing protein